MWIFEYIFQCNNFILIYWIGVFNTFYLFNMHKQNFYLATSIFRALIIKNYLTFLLIFIIKCYFYNNFLRKEFIVVKGFTTWKLLIESRFYLIKYIQYPTLPVSNKRPTFSKIRHLGPNNRDFYFDKNLYNFFLPKEQLEGCLLLRHRI